MLKAGTKKSIRAKQLSPTKASVPNLSKKQPSFRPQKEEEHELRLDLLKRLSTFNRSRVGEVESESDVTVELTPEEAFSDAFKALVALDPTPPITHATDVLCFNEVLTDLIRLYKLWRVIKLHPATQARQLEPVQSMLHSIVVEEERAHDERGRLAQIEVLRKAIMHLCLRIEEDVDNYLDRSLPTKTSQQVIESMLKTKQNIEDVIAARQEHINTLLAKRTAFLAELGETEENIGVFIPIATLVDDDKARPTLRNISRLEGENKALKELVDTRKKTVVNLAKEIERMLTELPGVEQEEVDSKVVSFLSTRDFRHMGIGIEDINQLAARRRHLANLHQQHKQRIEELNSKLKLIEDRQALLEHIRDVECAAEHPLRLFGKSNRLIQEDEFRRSAYKRLLAIERTLIEVLTEWRKANHDKPFLYKGYDYLRLMEEDMKTRRIPPNLFGAPRGKPKEWSDLEYVMSLATDADHDVAWSHGHVRSATAKEKASQRERRRLLQMGWSPPEKPGDEWVPPKYKVAKRPTPEATEDVIGTAVLPETQPRLFREDPHLLLPVPPRIRHERVQLRRQQLEAMSAPRGKAECEKKFVRQLEKEREEAYRRRPQTGVKPTQSRGQGGGSELATPSQAPGDGSCSPSPPPTLPSPLV